MIEKLGNDIANAIEELVTKNRSEENGIFNYNFSEEDSKKLNIYFAGVKGIFIAVGHGFCASSVGFNDIDNRLIESARNMADFFHNDFNPDFLAEMFYQGIQKAKADVMNLN